MAKRTTLSRREWLTAAGSALAGTALGGCREDEISRFNTSRGREAGSPPNIVVILADTLRADHLSCYGRSPQTSPNLDALAELGVLFENYVAAATWTKPSVGTMFTGLAPRAHQAVISHRDVSRLVEMNAYRIQALKNGFETLAELFAHGGYRTGYFQCNPHARPEFGYGQGFDEARFNPGYVMPHQLEEVMVWLMEEPDQPSFIFLHEIDPHGPYTPSPYLFKQLHGVTMNEAKQDLDSSEAEMIQSFISNYDAGADRVDLSVMSQETKRYFQMLYDAEIHMVDEQVGRFVNFLRRQNLLSDTVLVFTSDHGEGFFEHGFYGHSACQPYRELTHVPLIISGPGVPDGVRMPHSASMLDLYPTILALAGLSTPDYITGAPLINGAGDVTIESDRTAYIDLDYWTKPVKEWDAALVLGKYLVTSRESGDSHAIFNREEDPGEKVNLLETEGIEADEADRLLALLEEETARHAALGERFGGPEWAEPDDELREEMDEQLKALGYV